MFIPKILVFAGSTRKDSLNKKLAHVAAQVARTAGAEVTFLDLRDYPLPLYDGDLQEQIGFPDNATKLKEIFLQHQGLLISSPEYNSSISGVLKNAIDWLSIKLPHETPLVSFTNKSAVLLSASTGSLGGLRGLVTLRSILENLKVLVLPDQLAIPKAHEAFLADGKLKDPKQQSVMEGFVQKLVVTVKKLNQ